MTQSVETTIHTAHTVGVALPAVPPRQHLTGLTRPAALAVLAVLAWYYRRDDTVTVGWSDEPGHTALFTCAVTAALSFEELVDRLAQPDAAVPAVPGEGWTDRALLRLVSADGRARVEHNPRLWEADVAEPALARLPALRAAVRADPTRPLRDLDLRTAADRELVAAVNDTDRPYDDTLRLERLFEPHLRANPDAVALVDDAGPVSYREFDRRIDSVAQLLWDRGVRRGDRVAVLLPRGSTAVVTIYAILRVGAAYVPLDPGNPVSRSGFILADSGVRLLVVDSTLLAGLTAPCPVLDEAALGRPTEPRDRAQWHGDSDDPAYVIYTSGSTGRPKGVVVSHRSVVNRLVWIQRTHPVGPGDVTMQKTPLTFDVSVPELFWWGSAGATLCLLTPGGERDPGVIAATVARHAVTTVNFVPSMLDLFLDEVTRSGAHEQVASLRMVFASGEALTTDQVRRFQRTLTEPFGVRLVNLYGPTEAAVEVSHFDCSAPGLPRVLIGRPIDNIRLYVVDEAFEVRPVGAVGELCIAGVGLARGYHGRPELTRERFPRHVVAGEERVYRTGDLARLLPSGDIEYLGRLDHQIKIRGIRVELGEIEQALRAHDAVEDAVVVPFGQNGRTDNLCGYLVLRAPVRLADLRDHLAAALPAHMVPLCFASLPGLPLSPSGKLDRRALPAVDVPRFSRTDQVVPAVPVPSDCADPADPVDTARSAAVPVGPVDPVSRAWSEVLGIPVEQLRAEDNFYDLGGSSLLVLKLLDVLAGALSLGELMRTSYLGDQRTLVENRSRAHR